MIIYPSIDLKGGHCVQLYKGDLDSLIEYAPHPFGVAQKFAGEGASYFHVVDIDGLIAGYPAQRLMISEIKAQTTAKIQVGGGVRSKEDIKQLLLLGIDRVAIGSMAISQPEQVMSWCDEFDPENIVLALDVRANIGGEPWLATGGWKKNTAVHLLPLLDEYVERNFKHVLCTHINSVGTLNGPNFVLYEILCARYPTLHFQASGGVGSIADLTTLKKIGIKGAIIGKALYEKQLNLREILDRLN